MDSEIPYLPIDQFESQNLEELMKVFENEEEDWTEKLDGGQKMRYLESCEGYSHCVELMLHGMGMQKYATLFEEENISIDVLASMTDGDLLDLGITNSEDRKSILEQLKQFRTTDNDFITFTKPGDGTELDLIEDDIKITRNVYNHILELNSHLAYIYSKLSKNPPDDYLICNLATGLDFFMFTINHAVIQSNRISELLFGGQFGGKNMINNTLNVTGVSLPSFMREELIDCQKKGKKLKKNRLIITILLGIGIGLAVTLASRK